MDARSQQELNAALSRLGAGDRRASVQVFGLLYPQLLQVATRALGAGPDAEDAAQQALVRVFEQAHDYDTARSALAWAVTIVVWQCRTIRRARSRRRTEPLGDERELLGSAVSPEQLVSERELRELALKLVTDLSAAEQREFARLLDDTEPPARVPAALRKRKQRVLERLALLWRSLYDA
jgi:RNA polymerase sigma factor (sigma-70 family)